MVRPVDPMRAAARRLQIMEAASNCFRTQGFHQTSMSAICSAAGLSPGAVYRYFASKDALIGAIMQQHVGAGAREAASEVSGVAALRNFAQRIFCSPDCPDDFRLTVEIFAEARRRPEFQHQLAMAREVARGTLRDLISAGLDSGEFRGSIDPDFAASMLVCILDGLVFQSVNAVDGAFNATDAIDFFEKTARQLLLPQSVTAAKKPRSSSAADQTLQVRA